MSDAEDSENNFREQSVELDSGTSPESSSFSDPGTPSSHGLPKAATRARKKLNSDEEDSDFVPKEVLSKKQERAAKKSANETTSSRRVVGKTYAPHESMRAPESARATMALHLESPQGSLCIRRQERRRPRKGLSMPLVGNFHV